MKKAVEGVLSAIGKVRGGVKVSHNKNTADLPVVRMPTPEKVVLPMQQHIGAPCIPTVKVGDVVSVGQVIGDSDKFISAPIHASISGKVTAVGEVKLANGHTCTGVTITSDGEMRQYEGIEPPKVETKEDLIKAVRASGLVGLGGAGFPTHAKLTVPPEKKIDTIIVNAAECEPFITVDYRECVDNSWDVLSGVSTLSELFGVEQVIIAVEDNKPEAIRILKSIADKDEKVKLMTLESKYPQGAEKMMVLSATGRVVPAGALPADVGCLVMNVGSVAFISRYLKTGKPLVSRCVTVDGSAIANPKNIKVSVGTKIQDIIDYCGGFADDPVKIISGGPMMGLAIYDTEAPMMKQNNAILAFSYDMGARTYRDCIRCGRCASVCPIHLYPSLVEKFTKTKDVDSLKDCGVNLCMECGSCSFSCPSGRPLVQSMRLAKQIVREGGSK